MNATRTIAAVGALLAVAAAFAVDRDGIGEAPRPDGAAVFLAAGCAACHPSPVSGAAMGVAPDLTGVGARAGGRVEGSSAEEYLRRSIEDPDAFVVPGSWGSMPDLELRGADVEALVELLVGW